MCEPYHSIVQYPDHDDKGDPTQSKLEAGVDWVKSVGKKILRWFHFSKLGSGHSQGISLSGLAERILPNHSKYEASWWDRAVRLDGFYKGEALSKEEALVCSRHYADQVSIGSLSTLRRFLKVSMLNSDRPLLYVDQMLQGLLTPKGVTKFRRKLKMILGSKMPSIHKSVDELALERVVSAALGITRERKNLRCSWSDDSKLWLPGREPACPTSKGLGDLPQCDSA